MATDITELTLDTKGLVLGIKAAKTAFAGLDKLLTSLSGSIREAFSIGGYKDYRQTVSRFGKELADELLVLQLSFGRMKWAIADAVSPIASVFVPMLNDAIWAVIRFADVVQQFLTGLIGGILGTQSLAAASDTAAKSQEKLGTAAKAAGKAVRRSLAGFDQLERLNLPSSGRSSRGGGGSIDIWADYSPITVSPQVQAVVDQVLAILAPLMAIDLAPLQQALQSLWTTVTGLLSVLAEGLSFVWYEILTPFAAWILQTLAPVLTDGLAQKLSLVTAAIEPVIAGIRLLWEALKPVVAYIGEAVIGALQVWEEHFLRLTQVFQQKHPVIVEIFRNIAQTVTQIWNMIRPVLTALGEHFSSVFDGVSQAVGLGVGYILDMLNGLTTFLSGAFSGNWKKAWEGVRLFLKSAVNGVITLLNQMVSRLVAALNAVVRAANKLSFTVPEWVPTIGGRKFGVNLPTVSAPQIPYLARGAVLPANKPFLAMLGDQRHGTNVEAPLQTIQEAVALVMEDQTAAILRGFEASVGVQKEILEAVLGIQIGDEVLGKAVSRYNRRLYAMQGGVL